MIFAANKLIGFGVKNVLLKGGHKNSKYMEDLLINKRKMKKSIKNKKIKTVNTHGTGCTYQAQ